MDKDSYRQAIYYPVNPDGPNTVKYADWDGSEGVWVDYGGEGMGFTSVSGNGIKYEILIEWHFSADAIRIDFLDYTNTPPDYPPSVNSIPDDVALLSLQLLNAGTEPPPEEPPPEEPPPEEPPVEPPPIQASMIILALVAGGVVIGALLLAIKK